jgi:hypothetical protein
MRGVEKTLNGDDGERCLERVNVKKVDGIAWFKVQSLAVGTRKLPSN